MALSLEIGKATIEVIASLDPAIGIPREPREEYQKVYSEYLDTLDEAVLQLKEGEKPTRFVLRKVLAYGQTQRMKSEQAGLNADGKIEVKLGHVMEEVRVALIDVENPGSPSLTFKKDNDGHASRDLIILLDSAGITNELYAARKAAVKPGTEALKKS